MAQSGKNYLLTNLSEARIKVMGKAVQVNSELHKKLEKRLGLKYRRVHQLIHEYAAQYNLRLDHAAIKLAKDNGISTSKYDGEDYYNAVAGRNITAIPIPLPSTNFTPSKSQKSKFPTIKVDFSKLKNKGLRHILERDVRELNHAVETGTDKTSKTCMILSGSIAEAVLLERLTQNSKMNSKATATAATLTAYKPKDPNDIESWDLSNLVAVAERLGIVPGDIDSQLGQLRKWRNLVHPGRELKDAAQKRIRPTKQRAENAIGFLGLLMDEIK